MPYIIHLTYQVDADAQAAQRPAHREYLQQFYADGRMLMSGPRADGTGGVLVTGDIDAATAADIVARDPFNTEGVATYEVVEFTAANTRAGLLD